MPNSGAHSQVFQGEYSNRVLGATIMGVLNVAWPPAQAVEDQAVRKFTSGRRPRLGTPSKESPCRNSEMTGKEESLGSMASPEIIDGVPVESNETPVTELWDAPSWARGAASPRGSLIAARVSLFEQAIDVDKHQRNISKHAEDPEFLLALKAASLDVERGPHDAMAPRSSSRRSEALSGRSGLPRRSRRSRSCGRRSLRSRPKGARRSGS